MALSIQEVSTEISERSDQMDSPNDSPRPPGMDMDRVRRELRREISRLERLWTD
jgi:hypothetical protein